MTAPPVSVVFESENESAGRGIRLEDVLAAWKRQTRRDAVLEWIVTAYLLAIAVLIPASGWVGDRFGTKRIFLAALALFTAGSALCSLAWSVESLVAFRVIQGIGGGMMTPVGTAMLFRAFPPSERAKASAVVVVTG